jgi:MoaA/NifB/PqqE/SkfB family radical SAM enzyme
MTLIATEASLERAPATIHFLLTERCNLNCPRCYYRRSQSEAPLPIVKELFTEWARKGVKAVALGGGEPFLHPNIDEIIAAAGSVGLYIAVTTNGTILPQLTRAPRRVHISYDAVHPTSRDTVEKAILHFRKAGVKDIGVNHIVTSIDAVKDALTLDCDTVTLLIEKPKSRFNEWKELVALVRKNPMRIWLDACLAKLLNSLKLMAFDIPCKQGIYSMSINADLEASKCSNVRQSVKYTVLEEAWRQIRGLRIPCPGFYP